MRRPARQSLIAVVFFAVLCGLAAANAVSERESVDRPESLAPLEDRLPRKDSATAEAPRHGPGGHEWRVLVWQSRSGKTCGQPGQVVGGRVGIIDGVDKRFRPWSLDEATPCDDPEALPDRYPILLHRTTFYEVAGGPATIIWGIARADVDAVRVRAPNGDEVRTHPTARGAFLTAYSEQESVGTFTVTVELRDGSESVMEMPAPATARSAAPPGSTPPETNAP
jgi:hypothetical protein